MTDTYRKFDWNRASRDFATVFDDFLGYATANWTLTTVEAGAGSATEAIGAGPGGLLVVTNDAADNDSDFFQYAGGSGATIETFKYAADKKLQFVFRGKISEVIQSDFFAGLYITDTNPLDGVTDGIYFRSSDGSAALELVIEKNSTETALPCGDLIADTFHELEFYYDTRGFHAFVDGVRVAGTKDLTNAPDDEDLALSFGIANGEAVAKILTVDYIGASQQR